MSAAAEWIVSGIDVHAQDESSYADVDRRVDDLIKSEGHGDAETEAMLRAIVRVLRDAADGAVEINAACGDPESSSLARVRRFSAHLTAALAEISS